MLIYSKKYGSPRLIAHYMSYAKVLLQYVWRVGTCWDQSIDDVAWKKWQLWWNNLQSAEKIAIPRCYSTKIPNATSIQLHMFVDASDALFAAVQEYILVLELMS